jgi:hypothetical protein
MSRFENKGQEELKVIALGLVLLAVLAWNFWLPAAEDYFNMVSKGKELRTNDLTNVDFFVYYNTGGRFESGANPYYFDVPVAGERLSQYWYPPTFLPVYGWFSRLTYDQARLLWAILYGLAFLGTFTLLIFSVQAHLRLRLFFLAAGLTLTSAPLLTHIQVGQADLFMASLTISGYLLYARQRWVGAAALFATAALLKVSPVLFLIFFVVGLRDVRFVVAFALSGLGLILVSLVWVPFSLYPDYLFNVLPEVGRGATVWMNQSVLKYLAEYKDLSWIIALGGVLGYTGFSWWVSQRLTIEQRSPRALLAEKDLLSLALFMMNLMVILIFAGRLWTMAYTWTILPGSLLLVFLLETGLPRLYKALLSLGGILLHAKIYGYPVLESMNLWGALLVLAMLAFLLLQASRKPKPGQNAP